MSRMKAAHFLLRLCGFGKEVAREGERLDVPGTRGHLTASGRTRVPALAL